MKRFKYASLLIALFTMSQSYAQSPLSIGEKQLNAGFGFSGFGTPIYAGVDFGVSENITVGPQISYRGHNDTLFDLNLITIAATANYHFDTLLELPSEFNVYAGLTLGYYLWNTPNDYPGSLNSGLGLEAQIGGRYYFDPNWALNLEFGGGSANGGKVGISYIF
jgi:hypothetical protein